MRYERDGFSVESARKKKRKLPDWYLDQPAPISNVGMFYEAFRDLQTCRPPDGAIPWTAAMAYADRMGCEPDVADLLWTIVRRMDVTERRWRIDQLNEELGL